MTAQMDSLSVGHQSGGDSVSDSKVSDTNNGAPGSDIGGNNTSSKIKKKAKKSKKKSRKKRHESSEEEGNRGLEEFLNGGGGGDISAGNYEEL